MNGLMLLEMVCPVLVVIGLGSYAKKKGILDQRQFTGLKTLVSDITLPAVLVHAFYRANYDRNMLIIGLSIFLCCLIALATGFLFKKVFHFDQKLMPFLLTGFECGMLGYSLFTMLAGAENISYFATVDFGQVFFVFSIYLILLRRTSGAPAGVKEMVSGIIHTPAAVAVFIGILLGVTGVGRILVESDFGRIIDKTIEFIATPTSVVILLIVGYDLTFKRSVMRQVFITIGLRLAVMAFLYIFIRFAVFNLIQTDRILEMAILLMFALPGPFIVPIYANIKEEAEYVSATLSVSTLLSVFLFAIIAWQYAL